MGHTVIAIYRPVKGREDDLLELVRRHVPILRDLGLATDTPVLALRSRENGVILEIFDWMSEDAVKRAHETAEVIALWDDFDVVSDYLALKSLAEAESLFPHFERVDLSVET